jgi:hypothetical protein
MVTIRSTTYCEAEDCAGHVTQQDYPGMKVVVTDDPARPLALVPNDD